MNQKRKTFAPIPNARLTPEGGLVVTCDSQYILPHRRGVSLTVPADYRMSPRDFPWAVRWLVNPLFQGLALPLVAYAWMEHSAQLPRGGLQYRTPKGVWCKLPNYRIDHDDAVKVFDMLARDNNVHAFIRRTLLLALRVRQLLRGYP